MNNRQNRPYRQEPPRRPEPERYDMYAAFRTKERAELERRRKTDEANLYDAYRKGSGSRTSPSQNRQSRTQQSRYQYRQTPNPRTQPPPKVQPKQQPRSRTGYGTRVQGDAANAYRYGFHSSYRTADGRILDGFDKTGRPIYRDPYASGGEQTAGGSGVILHNANGIVRGDTRLKPARRVRIETLEDTDKKPFPYKAVLTVLICTACIMAVLYTYMELNEQTNRLSTLSYRLSNLRSQTNTLQAELVRREDLMSIEQTASEILGMVKTDVLTKQYVSIENEDKTEVVANLEEEAIRRVTVEIDLDTGKPIDKTGDASTFTPAPVTEAASQSTVTADGDVTAAKTDTP